MVNPDANIMPPVIGCLRGIVMIRQIK